MKTSLQVVLSLALIAAVYIFLFEKGQISAWPDGIVRFLLLTTLSALVVVFLLYRSVVSPSNRMAQWIRKVRGGDDEDEELPRIDLLKQLQEEITLLGRDLKEAKASAEEEARLRMAGESRWTAERLREHVRSVLQDRPLLVVANREPYMHVHQGNEIKCIVPASGLVTAMEPILRACGGTWVASGLGDADKETADAQGRIQVPPDSPLYTLKRVWLTPEEEQGYYYGFSNEGIWPLCHIAHTRPIFRIEDWEQYRKVNEKFAEAIFEELEGSQEPLILIQDYHFALLPRLIKDKRPDARIGLFWHIPWPNPESFGICPWARELLKGMLSADLLGFHIQFHCNNFLDTVDRLLESRISWEQFAINREKHKTWIKPFAISVAEREEGPEQQTGEAPIDAREEVQKQYGLQAQWLGVGVDRIDYTKGIAERFRGIERFLEKYPDFQGNFTFVELGAPSRTLIKRYHDLGTELGEEADRINERFQTSNWKPILFLNEHHGQETIQLFYQASNVCLVTSLHDGMNLVAKEYVAARSDEEGVLILSQFAGASRELRDSLLVNPYDVDRVADAIMEALTMRPEEQKARMKRMREILEENNVYRWAADLVTELDRIGPVRRKSAPTEKSPT